jgi:ParB-like nuclease domain
MQIEQWNLIRITPYARNARKIPPQAVDKVAASIQEFGWRQPIVVDTEGVIICGHTRLLAAQKLGLKTAPVHVADNLTPAQVRAYRLLDNRSHEESDWDRELLGFELLDLRGMGVDLDLTGFNTDELNDLLADAEGKGSGLTDEDAVPDLPEAAASAPGGLWQLGNHRLLCGDATALPSIHRVLEGGLADLVFCDPPYNVAYVQSSGNGRKDKRTIANDNLGLGFEQVLQEACLNMLLVTKVSRAE